MSQTFFQELNELEKKKKREKKERIELYVRNKSIMLRDTLPWIALMAIVVLSVAAVMYAIYLFVDLTRINDMANVHVTKNLKLALRTVQGRVYNDSEKGIKNWMLHRDLENGFEIAYSEDWVAGANGDHLFEIKKYNSQKSANESLAAIIYIDRLENPKNLSLLEFSAENSKFAVDILKKELVGGKELVRTRKQVDESGLDYSKIYWQNNGNNYCLKIVYYNQNNGDAENELDKIVSELKIL